MIVDSSAIIGIILREPGWPGLVNKLANATDPAVAAPRLAETDVVLTAKLGSSAPGLLSRFLQESGLAVIPFGEVHWPIAIAAYARFDGLFLMLDPETALINPTLLPFSFLETLKAKRIRTIEVDPDDHPFTVNGLAVRPGRVLMSETSKRTIGRLDEAGIEVVPLPFEPMYRGGGGIHCSTAPLARSGVGGGGRWA